MKIGFIGCGNMAQAMIGGIINSSIAVAKNIIASDPFAAQLATIKEKLGIETTSDNKEVAAFSDILILSVKPYMYGAVIDEIKDVVKNDTVVVTIAAGVPLSFCESAFGKAVKIIRTMPNTPALVGEGMTALCKNANVEDSDMNSVVEIFNSFGLTEIIDEKLMDMIPSISGSSPAYVYMFIEALADGAVIRGLARDKAYVMAAQSVLGAAKMVLETGKHPGKLKDEVCSPGGTTIQAVYSLEKNNFRGTIMEAMEKCTEKAMDMSGNGKK